MSIPKIIHSIQNKNSSSSLLSYLLAYSNTANNNANTILKSRNSHQEQNNSNINTILLKDSVNKPIQLIEKGSMRDFI